MNATAVPTPLLTLSCRIGSHEGCAGQMWWGSIFDAPTPCPCKCHAEVVANEMV